MPNFAFWHDTVLGNPYLIHRSVHIVMEWLVHEEILGIKLLEVKGYRELIYSHEEPYDHAQAREDSSLIIDSDCGLCL
jgi:hypothetical protein